MPSFKNPIVWAEIWLYDPSKHRDNLIGSLLAQTSVDDRQMATIYSSQTPLHSFKFVQVNQAHRQISKSFTRGRIQRKISVRCGACSGRGGVYTNLESAAQ
jgi:hypothetical protein